MMEDVGALAKCKVNTRVTPDHTVFQVGGYGYGGAGIITWDKTI